MKKELESLFLVAICFGFIYSGKCNTNQCKETMNMSDLPCFANEIFDYPSSSFSSAAAVSATSSSENLRNIHFDY